MLAIADRSEHQLPSGLITTDEFDDDIDLRIVDDLEGVGSKSRLIQA
jgi:hypothetical protein